MRRRGSGTATFLISIVVIAVAASVLYLINRSVLTNGEQSADTLKMRQIFRSIDLYESANNETPPSDLATVSADVADVNTFVSAADPFTIGQDFPLDPAFPEAKARSPFRISFTYLPQWIVNDKLRSKDWGPVFMDSRIGLLACYWYGDTSRLRMDGLDSSGPVVRINMDGSARVVPVRAGHRLLGALDIFNVPGSFAVQ